MGGAGGYHIYIYVCMHVCIYVDTYVCICLSLHIHTCKEILGKRKAYHTHTSTCPERRASVHTYAYTCKHEHSHMHIVYSMCIYIYLLYHHARTAVTARYALPPMREKIKALFTTNP